MTSPQPTTELDLNRAARAGEFAGRRGRPVTVCPYRPNGSPRERAQAAAWMNAYLHFRPPVGTVDYSSDGDE